MRAPRESLLFLGLLTAVCLLAGVVFGIASGKLVQPAEVSHTPTQLQHTATPAGAVSMTPGNQKSILVIGLTDASDPRSRLEGCWVITFRPGVPEFYVLAFPPASQLEVSSFVGRPTLTDIYAEDVRLQLGHRLVVDAVQTRFPGLSMHTEVVLDRADMSALLSRLGGLPVNDQVLNGAALLERYDQWDPAVDGDRAAYDGLVMESLFATLIVRHWGVTELLQFVLDIPRLQADPTQPAAIAQFAADTPPIETARLIWRVYGSEMEVSAPP